jgi:N-acetylglucosaminyldiphosphoundecaprenol N-acetyl-beta-D-mannosaminyltransferase
MRPPALLFGIPIDDVTMDESLDRIGELIVAGRTHARTHQVATVNVDFLVNSLASEELADILRRADLNLADGMPVVWGARRSGAPLRERVTGADLVPAMAARAAITGWHIHLFGSAPGVAEAAAERLLQQHPQARITADSGPMIPDVTKTPEDVLAQIAAVDADVLCLALGNPKQERFIVANRDRLRTPVMIGIGGTLDMIVGDKKRAPMWAQRVGLEWVFRALQEPRRLGKRYAHDARVFFPKIRAYLRSLPDSQTTWHVHPDLDQVRVVEIDLSGAPSLDLADWRTIVGVMRTTYHNAETAITGVGDSLAKQLAQLSLAHTVHGLATSLPNNER